MLQMSVPKFSGACVDWPGYYDSFTGLIHNNANLSSVQKLHFLKEPLPRDHDNDFRQMQLPEGNYSVAWGLMIKKLQKDNTELIRSMLSMVNACLAAFRCVQALDGESQHWLAMSGVQPHPVRPVDPTPSAPAHREIRQWF
ncbi:uncharacterized protein LOC121529710 [Drosophila eugracilis]|uniref:uncharacterized protein LOC121529710 n=1 Tax=Drosophila eugracilis TaxID=29029 RepID=UPI001BDA1986|nr:uncharacterized protein LOC121529710 [Drosophila eugracilis]